jgi:hypothetical protein
MRVYLWTRQSESLGDPAGYVLQHIPLEGEVLVLNGKSLIVDGRSFHVSTNGTHEVYLTLDGIYESTDDDEREPEDHD